MKQRQRRKRQQRARWRDAPTPWLAAWARLPDETLAKRVTARAVRAYLAAHPRFFLTHETWLARLPLPDGSDGRVVSLVHRQNLHLRAQWLALQGRWQEMLAIARQNEQLVRCVQSLLIELNRVQRPEELRAAVLRWVMLRFPALAAHWVEPGAGWLWQWCSRERVRVGRLEAAQDASPIDSGSAPCAPRPSGFTPRSRHAAGTAPSFCLESLASGSAAALRVAPNLALLLWHPQPDYFSPAQDIWQLLAMQEGLAAAWERVQNTIPDAEADALDEVR